MEVLEYAPSLPGCVMNSLARIPAHEAAREQVCGLGEAVQGEDRGAEYKYPLSPPCESRGVSQLKTPVHAPDVLEPGDAAFITRRKEYYSSVLRSEIRK
jgi:hypothetical protein